MLGDDVSIFFFNYDLGKMQKYLCKDITIDTTDADVKLNAILPFR